LGPSKIRELQLHHYRVLPCSVVRKKFHLVDVNARRSVVKTIRGALSSQQREKVSFSCRNFSVEGPRSLLARELTITPSGLREGTGGGLCLRATIPERGGNWCVTEAKYNIPCLTCIGHRSGRSTEFLPATRQYGMEQKAGLWREPDQPERKPSSCRKPFDI